MGNNSSISENVAGDGERDERELLGVVSALLKDDEALAEHCRELWAICGVDVVDFVPAEELQPVTQRLIDRMACRHPTTLERIGAVYTSFAGRQGQEHQEKFKHITKKIFQNDQTQHKEGKKVFFKEVKMKID